MLDKKTYEGLAKAMFGVELAEGMSKERAKVFKVVFQALIDLDESYWSELVGTDSIGEVVIADKCNSTWYDRDCPQQATWYQYFYNEYGLKVIKEFCNDCTPINREKDEDLLDRIFYENFPNQKLPKVFKGEGIY